MKTTQQIIACLFFLALAIKEGLSLKCYTCNTFSDDNCAVTGPDTQLLPCAVNETKCRKVEQHIYYNKQDHVRIFRQCATSGSVGDCVSRTGTYRFKSWYCHCSGNGCNSSGHLIAPIILTAAMFVASLGLRKL